MTECSMPPLSPTSTPTWTAAGAAGSRPPATWRPPTSSTWSPRPACGAGAGPASRPGTKWETVALYECDGPTTVVVNAAEGEPGSFKDRAILRANPFRVLEGALIAARAVDAARVVVATKASVHRRDRPAGGGRRRHRRGRAGPPTSSIELVRGPSHYLFGEETALLEVVAGRQPFPRIAPPYRRGATDVGDDPRVRRRAPTSPRRAATRRRRRWPTTSRRWPTSPGSSPRAPTGSGRWAPRPRRAPPWSPSPAAPGATVWPRSPMGTTLAEVIDQIGGGALEGRSWSRPCPASANPILPAAAFDTPLGYDEMRAAGSGLGATGFIVFDDDGRPGGRRPRRDPVPLRRVLRPVPAVQAGRRASPRSCSERIRRSDATEPGPRPPGGLPAHGDRRRPVLPGRADPAGRRARSSSTSRTWSQAHLDGSREAADAYLDRPDRRPPRRRGRARRAQWTKQPDWTHDETDSGQAPAERYGVSA